MGHHRGVKPGRSPEFCATLKLLVASVVRRRNVPPSSKVSKQWPRSCGLRLDAPSRASFPSPVRPQAARLRELYSQHATVAVNKSTGNLIKRSEKETIQDGDRLHIYYWFVGGCVPPTKVC